MSELDWKLLAAAFLIASLASAGATAVVLAQLRRRAILDRPNERSSHRVPTPRGGGLGVVPIVLLAWLILAALGQALPGTPAVLAAAAALAAMSWLDDLRELGPSIRLVGQAAAVALGLAATLSTEELVFQGWLPPLLDRLAAGLAWLWFVNLFNFMDGIDGITGSELVCLGLGLALVGMLAGAEPPLVWQAAILAGAGLGFLVWNWHPARVFLGDVGSVPLGYLAGWLLIGAAVQGLWLTALILPLYYLADATLTLLRRLLRGEPVWQAHREHFYQKGVQRGLDHAQVVHRILLANLGLIGAAAASLAIGGWALPPAATVVAILLWHLAAVGDGRGRGAQEGARR